MASDKGPIATEPPLSAALALASPVTPSALVASDSFALDPARAKSLKRTRETTPTSPKAQSAALLNPTGSPNKSARFGLTSRRSPTPLTGQAALDDERRRREDEQRLEPPGSSENPASKVLSALASATAMSRPADAPAQAPTAAMEAPAKPPPTVSIPSATSNPADKAETSPRSASSVTSISNPLAAANPTAMDAMEVDHKNEHALPPHPGSTQEDKPTPGSLSYPGSLQTGVMMPAPPARGLSFPIPGQESPDQRVGKRHKCPYCETEFTRHHNLKSHLLTHSQEKPYVCQECQMRFRRLHDLKRHSKLHTGEKPHICPKCDRKFARGDALARHSKGAGGCAGRRSSMGSFADGDELDGASMTEGDDSTMAGVVYGNEDELTDEERRRLSLPSIKAQHVAQPPVEGFSAHSRTYPPAGPRPGTTGGLYPPNVDRGTSSSTTSPSMPGGGHTPNTSISSMPMSAGSSSMYSQSGMTESPKPLSPGGVQSHQLGHDSSSITRQRSPSLTQQFQQQHYGRRQTDRHTPPGLSIPPSNETAQGPKLPSLSGFVAPSAQAGPAGHARTPSGPQAGSSGDSTSNMFAGGDGIWAYVQSLEEKLRLLGEKVSAMEKAESAKQAQIGLLTSEITELKKQLLTREADAAIARA